jgi:myo-inositol 2-dehydrogenase/D-chiro-inositol 1-dehydrogenase
MNNNTSTICPMLRVGIIGAGRIGRIHARSLAQAGAKIIIVSCDNYYLFIYLFVDTMIINQQIADPFEGLAEKIASQHHIPHWTLDANQVIEHPDVDAVVICSPTDKHAEQIIHAANHKKHIFCEKPIDLSYEIVTNALDVVEKAGVKLMLGFNRRFDANFKRIKQAILQDEVGQVNMLRITSRDPSPPPLEYVKVSGGMFNDMTIHDFDMARFLMQDEVEEVYTMTQTRHAHISEAGDIDTAVVLLKFQRGAIGYIENSRDAAYGYDQRVEVLGSKGSAACENNFPNNVVISNGQAIRRDLPMHFFLERYMGSYVEEMETFVRVITKDEPIPVTGKDGKEALILVLAANLSKKENRPVRIKEVRQHHL